MKLAVTGCNGAVGKRVSLLALRRGHTVNGIDYAARKGNEDEDSHFIHSHPQFSFIEADLREYDSALMALKDSDAVIQLAGLPHPTDGIALTHNTYVRLVVSNEPEHPQVDGQVLQERHNILERPSFMCRGN